MIHSFVQICLLLAAVGTSTSYEIFENPDFTEVVIGDKDDRKMFWSQNKNSQSSEQLSNTDNKYVRELENQLQAALKTFNQRESDVLSKELIRSTENKESNLNNYYRPRSLKEAKNDRNNLRCGGSRYKETESKCGKKKETSKCSKRYARNKLLRNIDNSRCNRCGLSSKESARCGCGRNYKSLRCQSERCGRGSNDRSNEARCQGSRCGRDRSLRERNNDRDCRGNRCGNNRNDDENNNQLRCRGDRCDRVGNSREKNQDLRCVGNRCGTNRREDVRSTNRGQRNRQFHSSRGLQQDGKIIKVNDKLDVMLLNMAQLDELLGSESQKSSRNSRLQNSYKRRPQYQTSKLTNRLKKIQNKLRDLLDNQSAHKAREPSFTDYYNYIVDSVSKNALNYAKSNYADKDLIPPNVLNSLNRLKRQQLYNNKISDELVKRVVAEAIDKGQDNVKIFPHNENKDNLYVPKWLYMNIGRVPQKKNIMPLRKEQKNKINVQKDPSSINNNGPWRRSYSNKAQTYGLPFQIDIKGLAQVDS